MFQRCCFTVVLKEENSTQWESIGGSGNVWEEEVLMLDREDPTKSFQRGDDN